MKRLNKKFFILARVGNDSRPAGVADIKDLRKKLGKVIKQKDRTLVTHHVVDVILYPLEDVRKNLSIIKVGSEQRPAGRDDIAEVQAEFARALKTDNIMVTHHNVELCLYAR